VPSAASVLRSSLLFWGGGHIRVGDRRGWLLLAAQVMAVAALFLVAPALIQGSRWIVLFPALLLIIVVWVAQAIHAHQQALAVGSAPGGELQIVWLLPLIALAVTAFWLVGGQHASPAATLQQYVAAWRTDRPATAARLFGESVDEAALAAAWLRHEQHLSRRVAAAATSFGSFSGLDARQPFNGLRFVEIAEGRTDDVAVFAIEITRRERIETTLFGLLPTATQQTVVVERIGLVRVRAHREAPPPWLPAPELLPSRIWLVDEVELPVGEPL
jgi:hypothetical protein